MSFDERSSKNLLSISLHFFKRSSLNIIFVLDPTIFSKFLVGAPLNSIIYSNLSISDPLLNLMKNLN